MKNDHMDLHYGAHASRCCISTTCSIKPWVVEFHSRMAFGLVMLWPRGLTRIYVTGKGPFHVKFQAVLT